VGHSWDTPSDERQQWPQSRNAKAPKEKSAIAFRVRLRGEQQRTRTFKRLTDAKAWAVKVESDLGHGVYVPTTADRRRTLDELIDKFITDHLPTSDYADKDKIEAHLGWWREHAGHVTLDKLTSKTIAGFRAELLKRRTGRLPAVREEGTADAPIKQSTVNRYLAALSKVCKWAWKELGWLPSNPVLGVSKGLSTLASSGSWRTTSVTLFSPHAEQAPIRTFTAQSCSRSPPARVLATFVCSSGMTLTSNAGRCDSCKRRIGSRAMCRS
jgi:hypothetical protein